MWCVVRGNTSQLSSLFTSLFLSSMDSFKVSRSTLLGYMLVALATTVAAVGLSPRRQGLIKADGAVTRKLRLLYFDVEGKGEAIRLCCAYAGLDLEDCRINKAEFDTLKETLPFGQLPILYCTDRAGNTHAMCQSAAIMRYIGKISGLYPEDPFLAARADAIIDAEIDLFTGVSVSKYKERFGFGFMSAMETSVVRKSLNDIVLPRHLTALENMLKNRCNDNNFMADTPEPTIADFILVPRLKSLQSGQTEGIDPDILCHFPLLQAYIKAFYNLDKIKNYYKQQ